MILVDLSQIGRATLHAITKGKAPTIDKKMLILSILNSIRANRIKFHNYGQMIICCDDRNSWRKDVYPYYKASRKEGREKSTINWQQYFEIFDQLVEDLKNHFPYPVIQFDRAEADDIIGVLCNEYGSDSFVKNGTEEEILILSGDKDFIQLHKYNNVSQYSPPRKTWIRHNNPENYLKEHIIRGDVGDGICNIKSPANSLVMKTRQKSVRSTEIAEWVKLDYRDYCVEDSLLERYEQNRQVIDLSYTPDDIKEAVLASYERQKEKKSQNLYKYFMQSGMTLMLDTIQDF